MNMPNKTDEVKVPKKRGRKPKGNRGSGVFGLFTLIGL